MHHAPCTRWTEQRNLASFLELIERGRAGQRVLQTIRTGHDGAFVILGPDPARVPVALRVPATGEVVALPQRASLQLRASR